MVEASACGIPIVVADGRWNRTREFISGNGIIAKSTQEEFASAIQKLLSDPIHSRRLGEKGKEMADSYDWDIITNEVESYYQYTIDNFKK